MTDMAKHAGLPWDCILGAELVRHYKPDREVYQSAADFLDLQPADVMMVAAHLGDLRAAKTVGLKTAFVARPLEYGPAGKPDLKAMPRSMCQRKTSTISRCGWAREGAAEPEIRRSRRSGGYAAPRLGNKIENESDCGCCQKGPSKRDPKSKAQKRKPLYLRSSDLLFPRTGAGDTRALRQADGRSGLVLSLSFDSALLISARASVNRHALRLKFVE